MKSILGKVLLLFVVIITILICLLSWLPNPNFKETLFFPSWLANWTDDYGNATIRTGVAFFLLALTLGIYLLNQRSKSKTWIWAWSLLFALVLIAEFGQYFLPKRDVDIDDILWGTAGNTLGLAFAYALSELVNFKLFRK